MKLTAHSLFKIEIHILAPSKSYILNRALEQNLQSNVVICYVFPICSALFTWYCSETGLCHFLYAILFHVTGTVVKTNIWKSLGVESMLAKM